MQQITIRGISPEVEKEVRKLAKDRGISINQVVKEIIHKEFKSHESALSSSLKELAGGWTADEAKEFERAIQSCEQIDEEMWE